MRAQRCYMYQLDDDIHNATHHFPLFSSVPPSQSTIGDQIRRPTSGLAPHSAMRSRNLSIRVGGGTARWVAPHTCVVATVEPHPPATPRQGAQATVVAWKRVMRRYTNFGLNPPPAFFKLEELVHSVEARFPVSVVEPRFPVSAVEPRFPSSAIESRFPAAAGEDQGCLQ
jgi:hypothetical protein